MCRAWSDIDFEKCEREVRRLQVRIAKAHKAGRHNKAKALQHLLVTSFYAKALAVRKVTSNKGKRTSGVDHVKWITDEDKMNAVMSLRRRGYRALPLKRVNIPKKNGKLRPLGIPTMRDRAMQALYLMSLEPITECDADPNSYGFRRYRSTADAIDALHRWLSRDCSPKWILEGDIKGCFDHISHGWLLDNVQIDKHILEKWLKCGVVFNKLLQPTTEGTPQGGIISPTLANATLDGMERMLKEKYKVVYKDGKTCRPKVNLVRYADDFIVTAENRETLVEIKSMLAEFLAARGLTLSEEKTLITHIDDGFDFLGFNIRKYNGTLLIKPSKNSQKKFVEKLHDIVLNKGKDISQEELIGRLNKALKGWGDYYCHVASKTTFCKMDSILKLMLMRWGYRRHPSKGRGWTNRKYFMCVGKRQWVFGLQVGAAGNGNIVSAMNLTDMPIVRHRKVKCEANPFDPAWDKYFEVRKFNRTRNSV